MSKKTIEKPELAEFNRLVGEMAGGICHLLINRRRAADWAVMTPAITYKVYRTLVKYPDFQGLHVDEIYRISKKIHDDVQTVLKVYDVELPATDPLLEDIEKITIDRLEHHLSKKFL